MPTKLIPASTPRADPIRLRTLCRLELRKNREKMTKKITRQVPAAAREIKNSPAEIQLGLPDTAVTIPQVAKEVVGEGIAFGGGIIVIPASISQHGNQGKDDE